MSSNAPSVGRDIARYEQAYGESGFEAVQAAYRKRMLLELLERLRPRRVIEVGCGLDTLANHWTAAERFTIVEPGARFAAEARLRTAGRADVAIVESTVEAALSHLPRDADLVLISALLHEVIDPGALLDTARELAGPDTVVHVNVPNARSFHRLLALEMGLIRQLTEISAMQVSLQQHHTFDLAALGDLAGRHGFAVVEQGSFFVKPFAHSQMLALQEQGFLTEAMLDGLWGLTRHLPDVGSEIFVNLRRAG